MDPLGPLSPNYPRSRRERLAKAAWALPYLFVGYVILLLIVAVALSWAHTWPYWFSGG